MRNRRYKMTLTKWKPFDDLLSLHNQIHRFFDEDYYKEGDKPRNAMSTWYPIADIFEDKEGYVFKLEVPGLNKEEIDIEICDNTLSIKGEKKEEKEVSRENFHRIERFTGKFNRSFTLPKDVDSGKINAAMKDGILELRIPKTEEKKAKMIPIDIK